MPVASPYDRRPAGFTTSVVAGVSIAGEDDVPLLGAEIESGHLAGQQEADRGEHAPQRDRRFAPPRVSLLGVVVFLPAVLDSGLMRRQRRGRLIGAYARNHGILGAAPAAELVSTGLAVNRPRRAVR